MFSQPTIFYIILASSFLPFNFSWSYFPSHLSKIYLVCFQNTFPFPPIISSLCFPVYLYSNYNSIPGQVLQKRASFRFRIYHCFEIWISGGRNLIIFFFILWCLAYSRHAVEVSWLNKWLNGLLIYRNISRNDYLNELTFCKKYRVVSSKLVIFVNVFMRKCQLAFASLFIKWTTTTKKTMHNQLLLLF